MKSDSELYAYAHPETWVAWAVNWSAIITGALAAITMTLIFGLVGTAIGATSLEKFSSWKTISRIEIAVVILASYFAFVIGGWVAGRITGARHSERTILHGVIAWLVSTPILVVMIAAGAGSAFGGWYGGLVASPIGAAIAQAPTPDINRGTALSAVTALLLGLVGSVSGGWLAAGEPMHIHHHKKRDAYLAAQKGTY
jgi:MFS family permease